jgi:hypothetical protein
MHLLSSVFGFCVTSIHYWGLPPFLFYSRLPSTIYLGVRTCHPLLGLGTHYFLFGLRTHYSYLGLCTRYRLFWVVEYLNSLLEFHHSLFDPDYRPLLFALTHLLFLSGFMLPLLYLGFCVSLSSVGFMHPTSSIWVYVPSTCCLGLPPVIYSVYAPIILGCFYAFFIL